MSTFSEYLEKTTKENQGLKNTKIASGDEVVNESYNEPDFEELQSDFFVSMGKLYEEYELDSLVENKIVPEMPVFLDSPLSIKLTDVYLKYGSYFNQKAKDYIAKGNKLFDFPGLKETLETEESKAILRVPSPKIIIAGSGMSNGGRILHHEKNYLPNKNDN